MSRPTHNTKWSPIFTSVVLSIVAGLPGLLVVGSPAAASTRPTPGDPGGAILKQLNKVRRAVPSDARAVTLFGAEPHLTHQCDSTTPGVVASVWFTSNSSVSHLSNEVGAKMRAAGWTHPSHTPPGKWFDMISGHQVEANNFIFRWTRRLSDGKVAGATLQVGVPLSGWKTGDTLHWGLAAESPGVDEPKMHCGAA